MALIEKTLLCLIGWLLFSVAVADPPATQRTPIERKGDILRRNIYKYYQNLVDFHHKLDGRWKPAKGLKIPDKPFEYLTPFRSCESSVDVGSFLRGEAQEDIFFSDGDPEKKKALNDSCLSEGGIPVLTCKEIPNAGSTFSICFCSNDESTNSPYVYYYDGNHCVGGAGSVCDGVKLNCFPDLPCTDGICGGRQGWMQRGFSGQEISFTDEQFEGILRSEKGSKSAGAINEELYLASKAVPIKFTCNPRMATETLGDMINLLKKVNTSAFDEDVADGKFRSIISVQTIVLDILIADAQSGETTQAGLDYSYNERCYEQFPRMSCVTEDVGSDRGGCECSDFPPYFRYVEEDGRCVGRLGSVCTTVRGSGDYFCQKGVKCESIGGGASKNNATGLPTPFTHFEFKVCGGWEAVGTGLFEGLLDHEHDMKAKVSGSRSCKDILNMVLLAAIFISLSEMKV